MSLLLDALKRAEQAKQEAGEQPAPTLEALSFDAPPAAEEPVAPLLITRDRLPDISQSLEILADDFVPSPLLRTTKDSRSANESRPLRTAPSDESAAAEAQAAVRRVFQVKETPVNPRMPFYIAMGVLGVLALGGAAYIWYQIQPRNTATVQTAVAPQASQGRTTVLAQNPTMPVAPQSSEPIVPPLISAPEARPAPRAFAETETPARTRPRRERAPTSKAGPSFSKSAVAAGPSLSQQAYAAFQNGDFNAARESYQAALAQDPLDRDALLGLAALDVRSGRYEDAQARYLKVLEADPRNANAQAGMIALRGQTDPMAAESRLKALLAQQPDNGFLNFTLGNLYAGQNRWPEAQQAYFKAYVGDPGNADYAFNLAVGLDHLRQAKPAADYYQKALSLAATRPANFNRAQVETRLRELQSPGQ